MAKHKFNVVDYAVFSREVADLVATTRRGGRSLALLVIHLGRVDRVNTTMGYRAGRQVIAEAGERLQRMLRKADRLHRIGESTFAVTLAGVLNEGHATLAAAKISTLLGEPFALGESGAALQISTGIALCPEHAADAEALVQKAELALQCCQDLDKPYMAYSPEIAAQISDQWRLENELDGAIGAGGLELFFQPKIEVRGGGVHGAEALVRWRNKHRGLIPPDLFIPMADRTGRIKPLTWFVIKAALRQLGEWPQRDGPLSVSVNLTPNIIADPEVIQVVLDATGIWDIEPDRLVLEVTELALMSDPRSSFTNLARLREMGFRISIDDFGTGYSSLAYFKHVPAHELKIDKSFVFRMLHDNADRIIVRTIIDLAHNFDMTVVAEGVEDAETLEMLREMDCDFVQGHLFSRPLPQTGFLAWLEQYVPPGGGKPR